MDDMQTGKLQIYSVEEREATTAVCIVRCVGGVVRTGQTFTIGTTSDATHSSSSMTLDWINRYEQLVDFVSPPHSAKVRLSGHGIAALERGVIISSTTTQA